MMVWALLTCAIALEVSATSLLHKTHGFRRLVPTVAVFILYTLAFYLISRVVRVLDIGITYALWSALGTVAIVVVGVVFYREKMTASKLGALMLIVVGVVLLQLGSDGSEVAL
jgi:small multidrug resistance pump